jgi:hypothetical protein
MSNSVAKAAETEVPLVFSGGHETDPQDHGRPVVLVAAGLGVKPEVFRKAFSGVHPARDGRPSADEQRRNKTALMKVLGPLGITNDRLDEVSNYYRYRSDSGKLWKHKAAAGYAVVDSGKVTKIVVTEPGAGYSSPPKATIEGMDKVELKVKVQFVEDLKKNGAVESVDVVAAGS